MSAGNDLTQITDRTVGGRVLKKSRKNRLAWPLLRRTSEDANTKRFSAGLQNGEGLRMHVVGYKNGIPALDIMAQGHGLGGGSGFIEEGGV